MTKFIIFLELSLVLHFEQSQSFFSHLGHFGVSLTGVSITGVSLTGDSLTGVFHSSHAGHVS